MSPSAFRAESSKHKMTWDNPGLNKIVGALRWADSIPCCPKRVADPELNHRQYPLFLYKRFPFFIRARLRSKFAISHFFSLSFADSTRLK